MSRNKARRYSGERKLNWKKVFAVIMVIAMIIMFIFVIKTLLTRQKGEKVINTSYFTSYEKEKYGVIDYTGKTIIEPAYAEYIVIPNHNKPVFLCTYDSNYETGEYKTKALNEKNEEIFTQYEQIEAIDNKDKQNNIFYNDQALRVKKDGKYGLINLEGKEVLACDYEEIQSLKGVKNSILVKKDGKIGVVDSTGKSIVTNEYEAISTFGEEEKVGYIVQKEQKQGVVDVNGKLVLETKYDQIKPITENDLYVIKEKDNWNVVKKDGSLVLKNSYEEIKGMHQNYIIVGRANQYGVVNTKGEEILPIQYEEIDFAFTDTFIVKMKGSYGLVNQKKEVIIEPNYQDLIYIGEVDLLEGTKQDYTSDFIGNDYQIGLTGILSEINIEKGYMRVRIADKYEYYNFKFEKKQPKDILTTNTLYLVKKDGKYGYEDKDGKVIVEPIYEEATEQNIYGYAAIKQNGKWGCIDKKGTVVIEPTYDLTDYPKIDFIGTWHLAKDLNMNCYTK